jgi:hypothetical protein
MSHVTSTAFRSAASAQQTDSAFLVLLTIQHDDIGPPDTLYFVNAQKDITSNGQTFIAFPFTLTLPADFGDEIAKVQLTIDNIDRRIIAEIRGLVGPPALTISVVLAPDDSLVYNSIEAGPFELSLRSADYDKMYITGELESEDILNEPYPGYYYTPQTAPGLWA